MENNINHFDKCANCGACINSCLADAIYVGKDSYFYEIRVDDYSCVNCGRCISVCPVNRKYKKESLNLTPVEKYEGDFITDLAEYVVENGGLVFGTAFSEEKQEVIFVGSNEVPIEKIVKRDHSESDPQLTYRSIKRQIGKEKDILFIGKPCQVAGLKRYLVYDYSNIVTCDFPCGGSISHMMNINEDNREGHEKVDEKSVNGECSPIRPYCTECQFKTNHYSDLTLSGIHSVIVNTEKGQKKLEQFLEEMKK